MRVREGTVTITGSPPHNRWSFCAQGHSILSQYQASYPDIGYCDVFVAQEVVRLPWKEEGRHEADVRR